MRPQFDFQFPVLCAVYRFNKHRFYPKFKVVNRAFIHPSPRLCKPGTVLMLFGDIICHYWTNVLVNWRLTLGGLRSRTRLHKASMMRKMATVFGDNEGILSCCTSSYTATLAEWYPSTRPFNAPHGETVQSKHHRWDRLAFIVPVQYPSHWSVARRVNFALCTGSVW